MPYRDIEQKRQQQRAYYARRRADWLAANGPCVQCRSWDRLEVDHIDPGQKVSHRVFGWAEERRLAELAKCQVLCYQCHKRKSSKKKPLVHGTTNGYDSHGCRCDACREAKRLTGRKYYETRNATRREQYARRQSLSAP